MDISYVIIEYRCLEQIQPCLDSLWENSRDLKCEYIVSSNSLYDHETRNKVITDFPDVRWIFNEKNGGYAYAMNRGLEKAKGEWIVLMNADARLKAGIINAVSYLRENPKIGIVGPKILDEAGVLQDSVRPFMNPWRAIQRLVSRAYRGKDVLLEKGLDYNIAKPVDWAIGALMMIRKSAIENIGLLDERYFLYVEDMDWCRRFWEKGFEVHYFPELLVEYAGTRSGSAFLSGNGKPGRHALIHLKSYIRYLHKFGCQGRRPGGNNTLS